MSYTTLVETYAELASVNERLAALNGTEDTVIELPTLTINCGIGRAAKEAGNVIATLRQEIAHSERIHAHVDTCLRTGNITVRLLVVF